MENPNLKHFVLLRDAPALTGRSLYTLRKYCREGKLQRYRLFGDSYLKLSELVPQPYSKHAKRPYVRRTKRVRNGT